MVTFHSYVKLPEGSDFQFVTMDVNWNYPPICWWKWSIEIYMFVGICLWSCGDRVSSRSAARTVQSSNDLMVSAKQKHANHPGNFASTPFLDDCKDILCSMASWCVASWRFRKNWEPLQSKQLLQEHPKTSLEILASKEQVFHLVSASRVVTCCPGVRSASPIWRTYEDVLIMFSNHLGHLRLLGVKRHLPASFSSSSSTAQTLHPPTSFAATMHSPHTASGLSRCVPHHPDVELSSFMHYGHAVPKYDGNNVE